MDRLKTLGIWVLLVIAFYIFSQGITYLFFYKDNKEKANNTVTNSATSEANESTNNEPINRIEILN